jgi:hypothetical protein
MEQAETASAVKPAKRKRSKNGSNPDGCQKKVSGDTLKAIRQISDKANKKQFGRRVLDSEILSLAVSLVTDKEIKLLQEATYSEKDRLHIAHSEYVSANGKITLDDFIGKLLRGEIQQKIN